MFRITEQENKQIRKMYGLISESTESDCNNNQIKCFIHKNMWETIPILKVKDLCLMD